MRVRWSPSATRRIAIMGHVGNGNLGDEAIIAAVIARLRQRDPGVDLVAFTSNPRDTVSRHGIAAFPIRLRSEQSDRETEAAGAEAWGAGVAGRVRRVRWLKALLRPPVLVARRAATIAANVLFDVRSYRRLRGGRLLVFAGSGQLNDDIDGPFGYPLTVLRWTVLGRLRGAAVCVASIGAGPVDTTLGRLFLRSALRLMALRSFRDPSSLAAARGLGAPEPNVLVRDLAFSHPRLSVIAPPAGRSQALCMGVNPLSLYGGANWQLRDLSPYRRYISAHAELTVGMVRRGWRVVLFPTQLTMDPEPIQDVLARVIDTAPDAAAVVETATGIAAESDLIGVLEGFDLVVATRYHGVLLALASGIPTVAVAYHPKTRDLMEHIGLGAWCLELEGLTGEALLERVDSLTARLSEARADLAARRGSDLEDLLVQYDRLLRLAGAVPRAE